MQTERVSELGRCQRVLEQFKRPPELEHCEPSKWGELERRWRSRLAQPGHGNNHRERFGLHPKSDGKHWKACRHALSTSDLWLWTLTLEEGGEYMAKRRSGSLESIKKLLEMIKVEDARSGVDRLVNCWEEESWRCIIMERSGNGRWMRNTVAVEFVMPLRLEFT